ADDYITKPFAIEELLARIRVAISRQRRLSGDDTTLRRGDLILDRSAHNVSYKEEPIELTAREFSLLEYLLQNKNQVVSRDKMLNEVWGFDYMGETNVVDVYISYLRNKIDQRFGIPLIETVRGVGYVIRQEHR
ncbi:MAG: response regulator transcription factor, partial [Firmicutes bacterium]|nr:response regulator transcription factor [Bacillota bacterium]